MAASTSDSNQMIPFPFSDLPEDTQLYIISFLTPSDITNIACTSHSFAQLCLNNREKLWSYICYRKWGSKTETHKWVDRNYLNYKQLHILLTHFESLVGFWRRTSYPTIPHSSPLILMEWGPSFLSASRVLPADSGYGVRKTPFCRLGVTPEGEALDFLYPVRSSDDLIPARAIFVRNDHMVVAPIVSSLERKRGQKRLPGPEHFLKIIDCYPTPSRPLQGLWKGIGSHMNLNIYLVEYDLLGGVSCRTLWDISKPLSDYFPVFWARDSKLVDFPSFPEEELLYSSRMHIGPQLASSSSGVHSTESLAQPAKTVSGALFICSSFDMVVMDLMAIFSDADNVEGMVWLYDDGTFGYGFMRNTYIIDMNPLARNGCLLDPVEPRCE